MEHNLMQPGCQDGRPCPPLAPTATAPARSAWREVEIVLLLVLVCGAYFARLTDLTIRGEESRWARVAQEMVDTGDWIVPRQQGEPFPDRPPLNSWAMIAASQFTGRLDLAAVRLPSVIATLITTLAIYVYARNFLTRVGALAAAAGFATMAQVLQLGRMAESDALLTTCLAGALFTWHFGYACRRSPALAWIGGYALAALAGLAKGPQGPVYFIAITTVFLASRRDWKFLCNRWHVGGLALFVLLLGLWQVPFMLALDSASAQAVWSEGGDVGLRFQYGNFRQVLARWAIYPAELLGCTMPWSLMLVVLPTRWFRSVVGDARPMVGFLLTACAVTLPTCWLPADSRTRYFMSLYPCVALLAGAAIERCWESNLSSWWQRGWDRYLVIGPGVVLAAAIVMQLARLVRGADWFRVGSALSVGFVTCYGIAAVLVAAACMWSRQGRSLWQARAGILAVAAFMALSYNGIVINVQMRATNDPASSVAAIRAMIPSDQPLVSFNPAHHLFAYYFQEPIKLNKVARGDFAADTSHAYFCYLVDPSVDEPMLPFEWELVAEISCERGVSANPLTRMVVGRRLRAEANPTPLIAVESVDSIEEPELFIR